MGTQLQPRSDVAARLCSICPELATFLPLTRVLAGDTKLFPSWETGAVGALHTATDAQIRAVQEGPETQQQRHPCDKNGVPDLGTPCDLEPTKL